MSKHLSKILVIDIEAVFARYRSTSEIIEVGIAEVDLLKMKIGTPKSWIIKPTNLKIDEETINLTGLTQEKIDNDGISFKYFCEKILIHIPARKKAWFSFGNFDKEAFEKQCKRERIDYPLSKNHYNIQNLLGLESSMFDKDYSNLSLKDSLLIHGFSFEGKEHKAKWDAYNTAKLVLRIFKKLKQK